MKDNYFKVVRRGILNDTVEAIFPFRNGYDDEVKFAYECAVLKVRQLYPGDIRDLRTTACIYRIRAWKPVLISDLRTIPYFDKDGTNPKDCQWCEEGTCTFCSWGTSCGTA